MRVTLPFDLEQSDTVGKAVHARSRYCFNNAMRGLHRAAGKLVYVEGFVVTEYGMCAEHAWLQHDGGIVDPTPNYRKAARAALRGHKLPREYFAAKIYTLPEFCRAVHQSGTLPLLQLNDPSYVETLVQAQVWKYGKDITLFLHRDNGDEIHALIHRAEEGPHVQKGQ